MMNDSGEYSCELKPLRLSRILQAQQDPLQSGSAVNRRCLGRILFA